MESKVLIERLEAISKAAAMLLICLYFFGFTIVSLRNGYYGFAELNPLRPKILPAGALFLFMTLLPAFIAYSTYFHELQLSPEQRFSRAIVGTLNYFIACFVLTFFLVPLYSGPVGSSTSTQPQLPYWVSQLQVAAFFCVIFVIGQAMELAWKRYSTNPMLTALFSGIVVVCLLFWAFSSAGPHSLTSITVWLFAVGVLSAMLRGLLFDPEKQSQFQPIPWLMIFFFGLGTFSTWIYPQFKPSWGGGSPIPVVVYFSERSRLLPGQQLDADLLDESESGIYIAERGQTQAVFVPRDAVALLYFSDKPLDSRLLK